jgi:RNA polymerase sigma-70 factor, ECF subfamily
MAQTSVFDTTNRLGWNEPDRLQKSGSLSSSGVHRSLSAGTQPDAATGARAGILEEDVAAHEEAQTMELVRRGDVRAFEATVEREWSRTFLYARYLLGDQDQAMDAAQEAFARLWQTRERWEPGGSVGAWLIRTVRNFVIGERRKRSVHHRWASLGFGHERGLPRTPLQDAETQEIRVAIEQAIEGLPPRRREVFVLFYLQSRTYREIADIMQIRPQSVGNYLQAALADLRSALHRFFPDPSPSDRGCEPSETRGHA